MQSLKLKERKNVFLLKYLTCYVQLSTMCNVKPGQIDTVNLMINQHDTILQMQVHVYKVTVYKLLFVTFYIKIVKTRIYRVSPKYSNFIKYSEFLKS